MPKKIKKKTKAIRVSIDLLNIFSSLVMIVLLLIVLYFSAIEWSGFYRLSVINNTDIGDRLFSVGIIIAIVTSLAQWIEGRTVSIVKSWRRLKGGV